MPVSFLAMSNGSVVTAESFFRRSLGSEQKLLRLRRVKNGFAFVVELVLNVLNSGLNNADIDTCT